MNTDDINHPDLMEEVKTTFEAYENALMTNDLQRLDGFFWDSPWVTRYGIADRQCGIDELRQFRTTTPAPNFTRTLHNLRISTFGRDTAIAQVEFVRSDTHLRGFQTQTWRRFSSGWKIVAAHVSMIPWNETSAHS